MKARIINLTSNRKRRDDIERKLFNHPYIEYDFFDAVDGRILTEEEKDKLFDRKRFREIYRRDAKPGEIGCTLSHRGLWEEVAKSGEPMLICEDDLVIKRSLEKVLNWAEGYLDSDQPRILFMADKFNYLSKKRIENEEFQVARPYHAETTSCYALNAAAARNLLRERAYYVADAWNLHSRHAEIVALIPVMVTQEEAEVYGSEINKAGDERARFSMKQRVSFKIADMLKKMLLRLKILRKGE